MLETLGGFCFIVSTVLFITGLILYMDTEACKIRSKMHIWLFTWCAVFFVLGSVNFIVCDSRHRIDYGDYWTINNPPEVKYDTIEYKHVQDTVYVIIREK